MKVVVQDVLPVLRLAIEEARAAGLEKAALELEGRCFAAYTTSSEWLGEVGLAIAEFNRIAATDVPLGVRTKLATCSLEIAKVWPDLGPEVV